MTSRRTSRRAATRAAASLFAAALLAAAASPAVRAQSQPAGQAWPQKGINIVVFYAPGASADTMMRLMAARVGDGLGQNIRIDNRPGGGGVIGTMAVKQALPDGYTLLQATISSHAANVALMSKLPYDPVKDFRPITLLWSYPNFLIVPGSSPAKTVAELAALAKSKPGGISYATPGVATGGHFLGEMLGARIGTPLVHVPYKGAAPAMVDLAAGRVDLLFLSYSSVAQYVAEGKMRVLAVASNARMAQFAQIPTMAEAGYPGVEYETWIGLAAPAGTPDAVVAKLNEEFVRVGRSPDIIKRMTDEGIIPRNSSPQEMAALIVKDIERLKVVVKTAGIKAE